MKTRGGKRIGAGAPKGNFNALKHARHSMRARVHLFALLTFSPAAALAFALRRPKNKKTKQSRSIPNTQRPPEAAA